jgi:hypothetical protein
MVDFEAIEKTLDDHNTLPGCDSAMEIEQYEGFSEPRRKRYLGWSGQ